MINVDSQNITPAGQALSPDLFHQTRARFNKVPPQTYLKQVSGNDLRICYEMGAGGTSGHASPKDASLKLP